MVNKLEFGVPAELVTDDAPIGWRSYKLATPLAPGATTDLDVRPRDRRARLHQHRRLHRRRIQRLVRQQQSAAADHRLPDARRAHRGPRAQEVRTAASERMRDRDDPAGLAENGTVRRRRLHHVRDRRSAPRRTRSRIAPGYLQKEWTEGGRRYFEYRMDSPILNFFAFQSGRYAVKKDRWNDVAIEVYYQPGHEYNLDRMIAATKAGLDYFTANFGPYQHKQFRIIEFPRYQTFAQSFPNTIPYLRGHRLHRPRARGRQGRHRLSVLRDGARARAPVVGAPGGGRRRAGRRRCWWRRWRSTRR